MSEWKRICCAVDFSEASRPALESAAELGKRLGAALTILHVVKADSMPSGPMSVPLPEAISTTIQREFEPRMSALRDEFANRLGAAVKSEVLVGDPAQLILWFARDEGFDLLVMGTHGRTGLGHLVMGSVAEQVLRGSTCPVMVVRRKNGQA